MALISYEDKIQDELCQIYNLIISERENIRTELKTLRVCFSSICDKHMHTGFNFEKEISDANSNHQIKFVEYDTYCHLVDILNDFQDLYGYFPEYVEMHRTLYQVMLRLADDEKYELAAILKIWVDKIEAVISLPHYSA